MIYIEVSLDQRKKQTNKKKVTDAKTILKLENYDQMEQ